MIKKIRFTYDIYQPLEDEWNGAEKIAKYFKSNISYFKDSDKIYTGIYIDEAELNDAIENNKIDTKFIKLIENV